MSSDRIITRGTRLPGRPAIRNPEETGNRTISVGLKVLQTVARMTSPPTVSEVAAALDMPPPRASRYLSSLCQAEFLRYDGRTGRFGLGAALIELGMTAVMRTDSVRLAVDLMHPLTESTGLVSILYVWGSNGPTAIKWEQGTQYVPIRLREGLNVSVLATAVGRVFLAYNDQNALKPILQRDLKSWNAVAQHDRRLTMKDVTSIRSEVIERGLAQTVGFNNPAIASLAAPIFGPDRLEMALTIVGLIGSFDASYHGQTARALKATTNQLSSMLGGSIRALAMNRIAATDGKTT
jgi:DNA-binding IclR family transcriptional regulator